MTDVLKSAAVFTGFAAAAGAALGVAAACVPLVLRLCAEVAALTAAAF